MAKEIVKVAAIQLSLEDNLESNIRKMEHAVRQARELGAQIALPSELFEGHYFCTEESEENFSRAYRVESHPVVRHFSTIAGELNMVLPVSFFETDGTHYYNSVAILDADGKNLGVYRKSHIPDGPGYEEKYYFRPGNTGFRTWHTRYGKIGVGICWDQWFPECARAMVLQGADLLFYPTAIGSEPKSKDPMLTKERWRRAMIGHAVSNVVPVIASNRVGQEGDSTFYGHSFIADEEGNLVASLEDGEGVIVAEMDLARVRSSRAGWGFFRDRRPDLYSPLVESH